MRRLRVHGGSCGNLPVPWSDAALPQPGRAGPVQAPGVPDRRRRARRRRLRAGRGGLRAARRHHSAPALGGGADRLRRRERGVHHPPGAHRGAAFRQRSAGPQAGAGHHGSAAPGDVRVLLQPQPAGPGGEHRRTGDHPEPHPASSPLHADAGREPTDAGAVAPGPGRHPRGGGRLGDPHRVDSAGRRGPQQRLPAGAPGGHRARPAAARAGGRDPHQAFPDARGGAVRLRDAPR